MCANVSVCVFVRVNVCVYACVCVRNQVRQGQWYCAGHRHQEGTEEYTTTLGNKN